MEINTQYHSVQTEQVSSKKTSLYQTIWRWHFYGGMIFAPILILLAITGSIYLFRPYVEPMLDRDLYYVKEGSKEITPSLQLKAVKDRYPNDAITSFTDVKDLKRATEVGIAKGDVSYTVFVNPYSGKVLGELQNDKRFMEIIVKLHGEIMAGKLGDNLVELSASWVIILLITGYYLYFPRNKQSFLSILRIRMRKGSRVFWRDLHASTGFWMTIILLLLVLTGLPWASSFGERLNTFVAKAKLSNAPEHLWDGTIQSNKINKDVAKTPWAAENMPVPKSVYSNNGMLPIENVIKIAEIANIYPGYTITMPEGEKGVYLISTYGWAAGSVKNYVTMDLDQYSGKILLDYRWNDYSPFDKMIETGIALHEGRYFGVANLVIALIACLSLILIVFSGITMWWKRRVKGKSGIPKATEGNKFYLGVLLISVVCGLLMPLVGISIFVIGMIEFTVKFIKNKVRRPELQ
ncbi:PepSY-associated TM helix domain-containing protein [Gottfriedia luciferensis]|uniref:PepSY-associated TM helix domain-containing protein n=1 Tax=Gottfriedia luciferensis TaxID=178774 RepID=UPI000B45505F|nr:PepSY domain-containing protein [Gottfriedia luciferensis]